MPSVWGATLARVTGKDHFDEFDDDLGEKPRRKGRFDRGSGDVFHSDQLENVGADMAFRAARDERLAVGDRRRDAMNCSKTLCALVWPPPATT